MTTDELVSVEVAKFAEELGYDEVCYYILHEDYGIVDNSRLHKNSHLNVPTSEFNKYITVPTQTSAQRWLRENHKIEVESVRKFSEPYPYGYEIKSGDGKRIGLGIPNKCEKYEEALERGLVTGYKMLKNIVEMKEEFGNA
jgi:hypothetical protein